MKNKKKIFSILTLAGASIIPLTALSAISAAPESETSPNSNNNDTISDEDFNNIFKLSDEGELTLQYYSKEKLTTYLKKHDGVLTLPEKVKSIGEYAFKTDNGDQEWVSVLKSIKIPNVTDIGFEAFEGCKNLTTIEMPNVIGIDETAFEGCTNLTNVYIPKVKFIGQNAFKETPFVKNLIKNNNQGLAIVNGILIAVNKDIKGDLVLPNEVTSISNGVFYRYSNLNSIDMPNVKFIGYRAFRECENLKSINIPKIEKIGEEAFYGCNNLTSLVVPDSVIEIGDVAFYAYGIKSNYTLPEKFMTESEERRIGLEPKIIPDPEFENKANAIIIDYWDGYPKKETIVPSEMSSPTDKQNYNITNENNLDIVINNADANDEVGSLTLHITISNLKTKQTKNRDIVIEGFETKTHQKQRWANDITETNKRKFYNKFYEAKPDEWLLKLENEPKFTYPNKETTLASEAKADGIVITDNKDWDISDIKIVDTTDNKYDDMDYSNDPHNPYLGRIRITFVVSKTYENQYKGSPDTFSEVVGVNDPIWIEGFESDKIRTKSKLDSLEATFNYQNALMENKNQDQVLASEYNQDNNIKQSLSVEGDGILINVTNITADDSNGNLVIEYNLSKDNVVSEPKTLSVTGFETTKQREARIQKQEAIKKLKVKIEEAKKQLAKTTDPEAKQALENSITVAKAKDNDSTSTEDLNKATLDLNDAVTKAKTDQAQYNNSKQALEDSINAAKTEKDDLTDSDIQNELQNAIDKAQAVYDKDPAATKVELDQAKKALDDAVKKAKTDQTELDLKKAAELEKFNSSFAKLDSFLNSNINKETTLISELNIDSFVVSNPDILIISNKKLINATNDSITLTFKASHKENSKEYSKTFSGFETQAHRDAKIAKENQIKADYEAIVNKLKALELIASNLVTKKDDILNLLSPDTIKEYEKLTTKLNKVFNELEKNNNQAKEIKEYFISKHFPKDYEKYLPTFLNGYENVENTKKVIDLLANNLNNLTTETDDKHQANMIVKLSKLIENPEENNHIITNNDNFVKFMNNETISFENSVSKKDKTKYPSIILLAITLFSAASLIALGMALKANKKQQE